MRFSLSSIFCLIEHHRSAFGPTGFIRLRLVRLRSVLLRDCYCKFLFWLSWPRYCYYSYSSLKGPENSIRYLCSCKAISPRLLYFLVYCVIILCISNGKRLRYSSICNPHLTELRNSGSWRAASIVLLKDIEYNYDS